MSNARFLFLTILVLGAGSATAVAADPADVAPPPAPKVKELSEAGVLAIERGLDWLAGA